MFNLKSDKKSENERVPPGQFLTEKFPVLHYGRVPVFNESEWSFKVSGEVERPFTLTWQEFDALPKSELTMDIHCVTRWSKLNTSWKGVHLRTLVDGGLLKIKPSAKYLIQHAELGFTANIPLEVALQENFMMATHFNGIPITPDHGYPLRGIIGAIPSQKDLKTLYFWKGAKWLRGLEFRQDDQPGFWEQAGYHNEADVWLEERTEN